LASEGRVIPTFHFIKPILEILYIMNIFYLDTSAEIAARMQHNRHVVKMIVETAQLLCTAHRVIDGELKTVTVNGKEKSKWIHPDLEYHNALYRATHINHPSAIWARQSSANYNWLYRHFLALMTEYTYRYGKNHKCEYLIPYLANHPEDISLNIFTVPPQCMPDDVKDEHDTVKAYRNYYNKYKKFAKNGSENKFTPRNKPEWLTW